MAYLGRQPNTGVRSRFIFTATASQTTFSGSDDDGKTLKYEDAAYVDVFLNGVLLKPVTDYTATSKTSVVLTSAAAASDIVEIVAYDIASIADTVSKANGGTFDAGVTVNGDLTVDTNTLYVDSANNRVGIGETAPLGSLHIKSEDTGVSSVSTEGDLLVLEGTETGLSILSAAAAAGYINFGDNGDNNIGMIIYDHSANAMKFWVNAAQRMMLDQTGNMLVGTTDGNPGNNSGGSDVGVVLDFNGKVLATANNAEVMVLNRQSSDGTIAEFRKDGTAVGVIGNLGAYMYLASKGAGSRGVKITDNFIPADTSGNNNDNAMDLGGASVRWDDVYATNGTIQTSDVNEKQDVAELDEAEKRVATAAKGLIRKFRWISSVEEKGDDARIHVGVIAQDLKAAFEAEGLDPGRYAMFISSTWWEADEVVPAVEEVLDEEGNVITEAQPEYTRTNTYQTAEEAPAGAVERTRLGVRYNQLLAFIIGAI